MQIDRLPSWWSSYVNGIDIEIYKDDYSIISDILNGDTILRSDENANIYEICTPLDIMTTEEMREILDSCHIIED